MSKRIILSRPRTRVYDANYNMGENMYRPALDRLNRKYSGRPLSPPPVRSSSIPNDILERHERAFFDDSLENSRRRAEKTITKETLFDSRGARLDPRELLNNFDEETLSRIKSIRATKKVATTDDIDMETSVNNLNGRRFLDRTEKILNSAGLTNEIASRRAVAENIAIERRSVRVNQEEDAGVRNRDLTKWTAIKDEAIDSMETAALARAKQSRARLNDLNDEMEAIEARAHEREKRNARLRALIAEVAVETDVAPSVSARRAIRFKERQEEI